MNRSSDDLYDKWVDLAAKAWRIRHSGSKKAADAANAANAAWSRYKAARNAELDAASGHGPTRP